MTAQSRAITAIRMLAADSVQKSQQRPSRNAHRLRAHGLCHLEANET